MLEIKNLTVSVKDKVIINNLNLKIKDGEIHALMGPNGVGKSTIAKILMNNDDYVINKGTCFYQNLDLTKASTDEIAKMGIFLLNQNPIAVEGVTNAQMLRAALGEKGPVNVFEFNQKLEELCQKLNLSTEFIHREINLGMSGGERKKNELIHLWMLKPNFIILDEIDSGLDIDSLKDVFNSLNEYYNLYKPAILLITHHPAILSKIKPDFVHILNNGMIVETGDASLAEKIEKSGFTWTNDMSGQDET